MPTTPPPGTLPKSPPRSPRATPHVDWRTPLVVITVVVGGVFVLGAAFVLYVWVGLSGGWDDAFRFDRPTEADPAVQAAREEVESRLVEESAGRVAEVVRPALGPGATRAGWVVLRLPCDEGQHNWKIDDDFDLACQLEVMEVVTLDDRAGFRAEMVALDEALRSEGWRSDEYDSMSRVLEDYWDRDIPDGALDGGQFSSGPETYSMDDLPQAEYRREAPDARPQRLTVSWAERHSGGEALTFYGDWSDFHEASGATTTQRDLVGAIPRRGYAVTMTLAETYFRE